ncbi:unnamed protein product [Plutella xylostella]|uniref:(diamondback moth) hypothetical protein n=1 Tax=Plutella xylostella TaxID=51655 RepID=A0A8S4FY36_PLUXY|nr:unnamed protein product [Plutella xylostella]
MDRNNIIEQNGFYFIHNFDSGNLGHVESVPAETIEPSVNYKTNLPETPDYEFNLWTRPDCAGTEFENGNRTWFYFGIQATEPGVLVRLNLINLNKQGKMYSQGMAPVTRTLPGQPAWERIRDRPVPMMIDENFSLSFKYRTSENLKATTFFAFTYPFSFAELQISLNSIDSKLLPLSPTQNPDDIYYCRECVVYSLEGRRVDLLTITSHHGITSEREDRLQNLFPDKQDRPFKFNNKKIIFMSARVHPGESPSSFVFNGFLNLILNRNDPVAVLLRKLYVFKLIPFLNPDGVARGHYRTDTRGVNLNRVYLNPSLQHHPTVYAARALIRYYHFGCEKEDDMENETLSLSNCNQNSEDSEREVKSAKKRLPSAPASSRKGLPAKSAAVKGAADCPKKSPFGEDTTLVEQVYDMKIGEIQSDSTTSKPSTQDSPADHLLTDSVLRNCLGVNVQLSQQSELDPGTNPMRPLRDTLKNSISLLMGSSSSDGVGSSIGSPKDSQQSAPRLGWCRACRLAAAADAPAVKHDETRIQYVKTSAPTFLDIQEYREHQRQQFEEEERKQLVESESTSAKTGEVFFCTNCFKRFLMADSSDEITRAPGGCGSGDSTLAPSLDGADPPPAPIPLSLFSKEDSKRPTPAKPPPPPPAILKKKPAPVASKPPVSKEPESNLYLYIDLHGHASKKGIFMYGNHFACAAAAAECMLLPRLMALYNQHFHFASCNFTERNMYLKDRRDGMSREGSGRVAVLKATGLVRSYTLECNYNTGRLVNALPPPLREGAPAPPVPAPPKYTPAIYEEVGRALGSSILDMTAQHPNSRVPNSEYRSVAGLRDWLRNNVKNMRPQVTTSRLRPKAAATSPSHVPLYTRSKGKVTDERKENTYVGAKPAAPREPPAPPRAARPAPPLEPKPSALKRRNILAVRKPNASKTQAGGVVKAKTTARRSLEDAPRLAAPKRSLTRSKRPPAPSSSSSSGAGVSWDEAAAPRRRPCPAPPPHRLKKIRLKTAL